MCYTKRDQIIWRHMVVIDCDRPNRYKRLASQRWVKELTKTKALESQKPCCSLRQLLMLFLYSAKRAEIHQDQRCQLWSGLG